MKRVCSSGGDDRISFLPDFLQTHILSYLPLKDAFRSNILSTQWKNSSSSLTELHFVKSDFVSNHVCNSDFKFHEVIDQVLRAHSGLSIDELGLGFNIANHEPVADHYLDEWISIAVSHYIQTFSLWNSRSRSGVLYIVPSTLMACTTLKDVILRDVQLEFPTEGVCFPTLTELRLRNCCLSDAVFSDANCPVLEYLLVRDCEFDTLSISSSSIDYLEIRESNRLPEIILSIPNLTQIDYTAKVPPSISIETLASLYFVRFRVRSNHPGNGDFARKIFQGLRNARTLDLTEFYVEDLAINCRLDYSASQSRTSLEDLKLKYSSKSQVPVLKQLLRCYPNVRTLQLWYDETTALLMDDNNAGGSGEEKKESSDNILKRLKTVDFMYFRGTESEFELMEYIVENVKLETLNILGSSQEKINEENTSIIVEKLLYFRKRVKKLTGGIRGTLCSIYKKKAVSNRPS